MLRLLRNFLDAILQRMVDAKYTSRWIVMAMDLVLVTISVMLAYLTSLWVYPMQETILPTPVNLLVVNLALNALFFLIFQTHSGIIRYSTHRDNWRFFAAVSCSNILFLLLGRMAGVEMPYFASLVMKNFTFSLVFLVSFRNSVVNIFSMLTNYKRGIYHRGVIFGTTPESIALARAFFTRQNKAYKLVGFLTTDIEMKEKRILDLPVYHLNHNLDFIKAVYQIDTIIFAEREGLHTDQDGLLQQCLKMDLKVMLGQTPQDITSEEEANAVDKPIRQVQIEDLLGRDEIKISTERIRMQIEGKVVLVTGAAGSIGSEIVRQVARFNPALLLAVDCAETPLHNLQLELEDKYKSLRFEAIIGDVRNKSRMTHVFKSHCPQVVYHAAAYKHVPLMEKNPCEAILANVHGTRMLANHAIRYGAERFVMISTDKAVNPTNVMGASKRIAEIYVQSLAKYLKGKNCSTQFITTRFGNVLGSNGSVIPRFRQQIEEGGPVTVTHPEITRYFMTIPEACRLVLEAGNMGNNGEIYVFDMGSPVKINDLANRMIELAGLEPGKDIQIKYTGLRPGEKLYEELLNDKELTKPTNHAKIMVADVRDYEFREVLVAIDELIAASRKVDVNETVRLMKGLVPEFISRNSEFEELDVQLN